MLLQAVNGDWCSACLVIFRTKVTNANEKAPVCSTQAIKEQQNAPIGKTQHRECASILMQRTISASSQNQCNPDTQTQNASSPPPPQASTAPQAQAPPLSKPYRAKNTKSSKSLQRQHSAHHVRRGRTCIACQLSARTPRTKSSTSSALPSATTRPGNPGFIMPCTPSARALSTIKRRFAGDLMWWNQMMVRTKVTAGCASGGAAEAATGQAEGNAG
eukprot:364282-Chlamydomonas_euryale.AAC.48